MSARCPGVELGYTLHHHTDCLLHALENIQLDRVVAGDKERGEICLFWAKG